MSINSALIKYLIKHPPQTEKYMHYILRIPATIRELHTYGEMTPINQKGKVQHTGMGKNSWLKQKKSTGRIIIKNFLSSRASASGAIIENSAINWKILIMVKNL